MYTNDGLETVEIMFEMHRLQLGTMGRSDGVNNIDRAQ